MAAANTHECWSEFVGQKVVGCLFDALPTSRRDIAAGTKALVFEDGRALVVSSKGTYWIEARDEVVRAIRQKRAELDLAIAEIAQVLELANVLWDRGSALKAQSPLRGEKGNAEAGGLDES